MGNLIKSIMSKKDFCEFCEIINNNKEILIFDENGIIAFHDIDKSSAVEHILICPQQHIQDISVLNVNDIPLLQKMHSVAQKILEKLRPESTYRFGFHVPPINSIDHLHMHAFVLPIKNQGKNLITYGYMLTPPEKLIKKLQDAKKIKELKSD